MFSEMFDALDAGRQASENFYDGYVVNAIVDACYRSAENRTWVPVELEEWRASAPGKRITVSAQIVDGKAVVKEERMHGNKLKQILCDQETGRISERIVDIA